MSSTVELTDLELFCDIGTYTLNEVVPTAHILDLTLSIDTELVLISTDGMNNVFDYDPLITEVKSLACDGHYQTQERLISRIVDACAGRPQVTAIEIYLRKTPVTNSGGTLGIRIKVDAEQLAEIREKLFDNS